VTHTQPEAIALADMVVVMDTGRIEQAGSANEIYNRPTTPYVARFMGGQNVLTGKVKSLTGERMLLESAEGERFEVPIAGTAPKTEETVSISIRRDRIKIAKPGRGRSAAQVNTISGVVDSTEYQGSFVKVSVRLENGELFVAHVPDHDYFAGPVNHGDAVVARWRPEHVHVLSKADTGGAKDPYAGSDH